MLLSYAVKLTSYAHPGIPPEIQYEDHQFFVEQACAGNERCQVAGWYNNNGTIYLDERIKGQQDAETRSLVVHELTHYLQDLSGEFTEGNCEEYVKREREAYSAQRQYLKRIAQVYIAVYQNYPPCHLH